MGPVKWMYKQWAGLYEDGKQKLYVNPWLWGFGYPGRVGISPNNGDRVKQELKHLYITARFLIFTIDILSAACRILFGTVIE